MEISKIKIPGRLDPIDIKDTVARQDVDDIKDELFVEIPSEHDYVEIGGLYWAKCNIGAESETDYGLYFQWGDTQGYTSSQVGSGSGQKAFQWADYKFNPSGDSSTFTKYNSSDNKTVLDGSDDSVQAAWGGSWRMPTKEDFAALSGAVNTAWTADYEGSGVAGLVLISNADSSKKLFFPAVGVCGSGSMSNVGSRGCYLSSSLSADNTQRAYYLYFDGGSVLLQKDAGRSYGLAVRAVSSVCPDQKKSAKADRVENATAGNLAGLDAEGNLTDSGIVVTNIASAADLSSIVSNLESLDEATAAALNYLNNIITKCASLLPPVYNTVDMGLPSGTLWADRNIGAASETEPGLYFQWGDVEGFSKDSGRYCSGERNDERDWSGDYGRCRGSELGDSQNIPVDPYFDAARKNMGAPWRMPTTAEIQELFNSAYTTNEWVTNYKGSGMNGRLVTSKANGNKLFFPAAGYFNGGFRDFGSNGTYWSSSYCNENYAYLLDFSSDGVYPDYDDYTRFCGCSVRAVQ